MAKQAETFKYKKNSKALSFKSIKMPLLSWHGHIRLNKLVSTLSLGQGVNQSIRAEALIGYLTQT